MTAPALSLRGVMKQYAGEESPVLKDINLDVHAGEYVAIVGASGSGKSTLLNILGLLDTPSAGAFAILGSSTEHFTESDRNRYRREVLGFVLQSSNTIDDETCLRNVALAPQTQNLPIAQRWRVDRNALERVGLRHLAQQRTRTLSGGQRQRVAFARAIAAHPQILLADEPTGNLDTSSADRIMHLLKEAAERGVAVILVTHDLERARQADRVLQLRDGVLVEQSRSARAPGNLVRGRSDGPKTPETRTRKLWRSITDTLCDSLSSISLAPVRSLFLLLAFAVSVGGLFAASGIASSAGVQVAAQFAAAARDQVQVSFETDIISPGELDRIRGFQTRLAEVDEVSRVGFFITAKDVSVSRVGGKPDDSIRVLGATPEILQIYGAETQPGHAGELLASEHPGALISADLLSELNLPESVATQPISAGYAISLGEQPIPVVGTFRGRTGVSQLERTVILPADLLMGSQRSAATMVAQTTLGFTALVAEAAPLAMNPANPGMFRVQATGDLVALQSRVSTDLAGLVGGVSGVLLVLIVLSTGSIMVIAVNSRRTEIALRRILGASKRSIASMFLAEGTMLGVAGGLLGVPLGVLGLQLLAHSQGWLPVIEFYRAPTAVLVGAIAGVVSAVVPALRAASQEPAIALLG